jgi:hypothetical protein
MTQPGVFTGGRVNLLTSTSTGIGAWQRIDRTLRNMEFQATMQGSSIGALVSGTVSIEVSEDGVNPIATKAGTIAFSSVATPAVDGFVIDTHHEYVRANLSSYSTANSSVGVIATPNLAIDIAAWQPK